MRLRKFRVRAYRCIHDSGEITVGDLAAFVGRNESGKTTILQALTLLNKDEQVSDLDLCDEMHEELKDEIRIAEGDFDFNVVIRSILYNKSEQYLSFIVGGAITDLATIEDEHEECLLKAKPMFEVLNSHCPF